MRKGAVSDKAFGDHVRRLRHARGTTQEVLAERCGLSPDTIRRLEHGSFSPSLDTLRKLCSGLDILLSTLFASYELADVDEEQMLLDSLRSRPPAVRRAVRVVVRNMIDELDRSDEPGPVTALEARAPSVRLVR